MPQVIDFEAQLIVVLDGFDGWELLLVDLIYQFLETLFFVHNFLNFEVKKYSFCRLDSSSKGFPVIQTSCQPVGFEITIIFVIPPTLGVLHNSDYL